MPAVIYIIVEVVAAGLGGFGDPALFLLLVLVIEADLVKLEELEHPTSGFFIAIHVKGCESVDSVTV